MKKKSVGFGVIGLLLMAALLGALNQSGEDLFQKALRLERNEGKLIEAIEIYNKVVTEKGNEGLSAQAQLRIGLCYEKLGQKSAKLAQDAFQKVINNYPSQSDEVRIAKEKLDSILKEQSKELTKERELRISQVRVPIGDGMGVPSPDGRYFSYRDTNTGDLAIYEIATGKKRRLTNMESWDESGHISITPTWSPDSKQIVCALNNGKDYCDLRIIGLDGSKPRILYSNKEVIWTYAYDWSPDGEQILAYFDRKNVSQIVLVSTVDGSMSVLKTFNESWPENMCFSPDGDYIVYDFPQRVGSPERDLFLLSTDGNREMTLVEHPSHDELLGWAPDGKNIIFASDRNGTFSLWNIQISEGKSFGNPVLVKSNMGSIEPLGFTQKGSFYYGYSKQNNNIYSAELDPETGEILALPKKIITRFEGYNQSPIYSPDGKYLAYISRRFPLTNFPDYSMAQLGGNVLCVKSLETGKEREIFLKHNRFGHPHWSPDGHSVVVMGLSTNSHPNGYSQIDIQTGNVTSIMQTDGNVGLSPSEYSHDGKSIFYVRQDYKANISQILIRDLKSGTEKEIYRSDGDLWISLSPDGQWLLIRAYFIWNSLRRTDEIPRLSIIPTTGGEPRELCRFEEGRVGPRFTWTADGKYILFTKKSPKKDSLKLDLYRIPAKGGEPEKLGLEMDGFLASLSVHPNGRNVVFSTTEESNEEMWVMENFLPLEKLAQQKEKEDLLIRKVLADTNIEPLGAPSPDGRYISFVDWWSGSNLSILDLETKKRRSITDFNNPGEQAYYSSWSPDGKQIAYFWWEMSEDKPDEYNLSVIDVTGSNSRDLLKSEKLGWIELGNWSSDGRYIIATLSLAESGSQLVRVSTTDGSVQTLKTFEKSYLGGKPWISPDGRYVAYNLPDDEASGNSDIYIFSIEDKHENALFKHPAHDYILGWTPDGNNILFASDRTGTVDLMIIRLEEGKSIGQPKLVQSNIGPIVPMGFTQKGTFYYGQWPGKSNIYTTEIDFDEGEIVTQPSLTVKRFEGKNHDPSYSHDGKNLAYISLRGIITRGNPGPILCIRNLETNKEYEITLDPELPFISRPQWSPDDQSIMLSAENQKGFSRIYNYNIQSKKITPLVTDINGQSSDMEYIYPRWSKNGNKVYYLQVSQNSKIARFMARDIATGVDKELYRYASDNFMDRIFTISLSPDGKWLSAINRGETRILKVISTEGEKSRDLFSANLPGGGAFSHIWSKDGKYIIFPYNTKGGRWNLMRIPFDGGEKLEIEMNIFVIGTPSLHPDGRHLVFSSAGNSLTKNNIWEMENFLPKSKDKK